MTETKKISPSIALLALFSFILIGFSSNAFSASQLTLELNDSGIIYASHVSDNDKDIEFIDLFIVSENETQEFSFTNVIEGQELASIQESQSGHYNFMDDEGSEKGLGMNLPIYGIVKPNPTIIVIENASIMPNVVDENNAQYELQITVDVNENYPLNRVIFDYSIENGLQNQSIELQGGPKTYAGSISPFTGEIIIDSGIKAIDEDEKEFTYEIGKRAYNLMAINPFCGDINAEEGSFAYKKETPEIKNLNFNNSIPKKENSKNKIAFFAAETESSIHLMFTENQSDVLVQHVFDDDDSIERLDVYYDNGNEIIHEEFDNATEGMLLELSIPKGKESYYSFFDNDGSIKGTGFFLQINEFDFCTVYPENPSCIDAPEMIESASLNARADNEMLEYYLDIEVKTVAGTSPDEVKFYYSINGSEEQFISLNSMGNNLWSGSIGPFDGETNTISYAAAFDYSDNWTDSQEIIPRWDKLLVGLFECTEICFDETDNDNDGFIDEGCSMLPQLYARTTYVPEFILVGTEFDLSYAIENSGGSDANNFKFKALLDGNLLADEDINSLESNESKEFTHRIYSGTDARSVLLNIQVDYQNEITESIESDNNFTQLIEIMLNRFDVNFNYNNTEFLGDLRQTKFRDLFRRDIKDANVTLTYPNGKKIEFVTNAKGIIEFTLTEGGTYIVEARKNGFEGFEGSFEVAPVNVSFKKTLEKGERQTITVTTSEGIPVTETEITILTPSGKTIKVTTNSEGKISLLAEEKGTYGFMAKRKDTAFYASRFDALQTLEEIMGIISSSLLALAGSTPAEWLLFIILLLLSFYAARKAFQKLRKTVKSAGEKERKKQLMMHAMIAGIVFVVPIAVKTFIGIALALFIALIEIMALLAIEYFEKLKEKGKKIKV